MAAVYAAIFGPTFAQYYGGSILLYGTAVYIGLTLIGFFIAATTECSSVLVQNGGLLNKVGSRSRRFRSPPSRLTRFNCWSDRCRC